jgi:MSHA pilin protein MshD
MSNERGFTLVEMLVAIVVIGVGIAGVMLAFSSAVRGSADPVVSQQMLAIAEEMLEEIELKPYGSSAGAGGCLRSGFASVLDYTNYDCAVQTVDGTTIPELAGYTVKVNVTTPGLSGVGEARRIEVTVTRGSDALKLVGWRTNYGG